MDVLEGDSDRAFPPVRDVVGDHLEEHDAGRVNVGPPIRVTALHLLRCEVCDGAHNHAGGCTRIT